MKSFHGLMPQTVVLALLCAGLLACPDIVLAQVVPFLPTGSMTTARFDHTTTLLNNGKVLITGGRTNTATFMASAELYDPVTGTFTATGSMTTGRESHTATLLNDGKVLVAGGDDLGTAELYDPATGTFIATGSMITGRESHTATLLNNGKVLIAGGLINAVQAFSTNSAELYDPVTGTFTATGSMITDRASHTATLLNNGTVLVTGGGSGAIPAYASAEVYDPTTGTFTATGSMNLARSGHTATLLNNGTVLVAGGNTDLGATASAELYDSTTGIFTFPFTPTNLTTGRAFHTATLLNNGTVLVAGGNSGLGSADLYNPATETFTAAGSMTTARYAQTATLLNNGTVLVAGGENNWEALSSAELYDIPAGDSPAVMSVSGTGASGPPNDNFANPSGGTVMVSTSETRKAIGTESGLTNSAVGSTCGQNLAIGSFTLCGEVYNDVSTGTNVKVNYSPSSNNAIIAWATWCFTSSCNSSISGVTATIGDNVNATESCFVASPHSPFITNGNGGGQGSGDFEQHYVWYCPSIPSGVISFTVTPSNPNLSYLQLNISEWKAGSLAASCSPISACFENVDNFGQAGNSTGGTTATITTSGPTVNANDLIFAVTEVPCCSFTASPGTGYTGITVAPSVTPGMVSEAKAATTGIQTATTTWTGGSASWFGEIVPIIGAGAAPVAAFIGSDTRTQGNWQGTYGADGYSIANYAQSLPSYATFTPQNDLLWTWASSTTDVRALRLPNSSLRVASTWYNNPSFSYDVNITDGNTHQIALYALDWDSPGGVRSENIQIVDANNPSHVLDTETLLSYTSGTYLVWNINGHVTINVTRTGGANAVISGVFFGAPPQTAPAITSAGSTTFTVGSSGSFTVTATGSPTPTLSETGALPSGVLFNTATGVLSGTPATGTNGSYLLTFTASNGVSPNSTQTFTLTVNPASASGSGVTFVGFDTTTQGNWQGTYGADGYSIANYAQSLPSYATFTPQNDLLWTWASSTTDVRALKLPNSSLGVASAWYNNPSFSYDVNITDGNTHQIALYALDWDSPGGVRSETVQIVDANNPSHVLDTETLLSYTSGTYLVWNINGHVTINVTRTGGANAVISGVFFGAPPQTAPSITSAGNTTFTVGSSGSFTVTATGSPTPTLSEMGSLPSGVMFNTSTGILSGTPATGTNGSYSLTFTASNGVSPNAVQTFTLTVNPASASGSGVTFVGFDTTTQGNWQGTYGADGYSIANYAQSLPSYATFTPQNDLLWTWASSTTDVRALKLPNSSLGVASAWYNNPSFSYDVNITDGNTHQIALYALDWDSPGGLRSENIQIVDANNPSNVLDSESLADYQNGVYLVWKISGHVTINVTRTAGANAVISGVFFK